MAGDRIAPISFPAGTIIAELSATSDSLKTEFDNYKKDATIIPLRHCRDNIKRLIHEELEVKDQIDSINHWAKKWSYMGVITSVVQSCFVIGAGLYFRGNHPQLNQHTHFIGAGSLLLFNTMMQLFNGWETVAKVVSLGNERIQSAVQFIPTAINLACMFYTIPSINTLPEQTKVKLWLERCGTLSGIAMSLVSAYTVYKKGLAQAQLIEIQGELESNTFNADLLTEQNDYREDLINQINSGIRRAIKSIFNHTSRAAQSN